MGRKTSSRHLGNGVGRGDDGDSNSERSRTDDSTRCRITNEGRTMLPSVDDSSNLIDDIQNDNHNLTTTAMPVSNELSSSNSELFLSPEWIEYQRQKSFEAERKIRAEDGAEVEAEEAPTSHYNECKSRIRNDNTAPTATNPAATTTTTTTTATGSSPMSEKPSSSSLAMIGAVSVSGTTIKHLKSSSAVSSSMLSMTN
jgi:hypothetical protein